MDDAVFNREGPVKRSFFEHTLEGNEGVSPLDVWERSVLDNGNNRGKTAEPSVAGAGAEESRIAEVVSVLTRTVTPSASDPFLCL